MDDTPAGHASGGDGAFDSNLLDDAYGLSAQAQGNLARVYQMLDGVDETDPEFERTVREDVIERDFFQRGDIEALNASVCAAGSRYPGSTQLLIAFFVVFEWYHRCEFDVRKRLVAWQRLIRCTEPSLSEFALYQYALSRFAFFSDDRADAECAALKALDIAPNHRGLLNTYAELLLDRVEGKLLSTSADLPSEDLDAVDDLLQRMDRIESSAWHPIHYVTYGRLQTCRGRFDDALKSYDRALEVENETYDELCRGAGNASGEGTAVSPIKSSTYVSEVNEIFESRARTNMIANAQAFRRAIEAAKGEEDARANVLKQQMDDLGERFDSERVDMLEFIGFFAGIISFVIASIQLGDGLEFPTRALMVLVLMGSLLVAFGAFSILLELGRGRKGSLAPGMRTSLLVVIGIGMATIVIALAMYVVIR